MLTLERGHLGTWAAAMIAAKPSVGDTYDAQGKMLTGGGTAPAVYRGRLAY